MDTQIIRAKIIELMAEPSAVEQITAFIEELLADPAAVAADMKAQIIAKKEAEAANLQTTLTNLSAEITELKK